MTIRDLAALLYFTAGVTRRRPTPRGTIEFRAAPCTGALYEIDLYAVCADLDGLEAGVYFFDPRSFSLQRLRSGDCRDVLRRATAGEPSVARAPVTLISAGTYWRNAWKYRARTYRHFGWDNGTMFANLLAIALARRLPARVVSGFVDRDVNELLALETDREVALHLVPLGRAEEVAESRRAIERLELRTVTYSRREVDYPAMRTIHEASSLESAEDVAAWRGGLERKPRSPAGKTLPLDPLRSDLPPDSIEQVIRSRGSSRAFRPEAISLQELSNSLNCAIRDIDADFLETPGERLNDVYVIANAIDGLEPGAYAFDRESRTLELAKAGDFRRRAGYLGLEQALPADASADVFFLADLEPILERFGNRGYRAVQLEAGILGGRLYLAQYAQRLGATGLTFYDDDVTSFFSPDAAGKSAIFLVALGRTAKPRFGW